MKITVGKIKKAFTLAEVLITLGIIGIVAAITIPQLLNQTQEKELKEAAKEAFSKASQAVQLMKTNNGGTLADLTLSNYAFGPVFKNNFKVADDCYNSGADNYQNCIPAVSASTVYKSLFGNPAVTSGLFNYQFVTTDGMFWGVGGTITIAVDVNGYKKGPNVYGRDVFVFEVKNEVLIPEGAPASAHPNYYCQRDMENGGGQQGIACMNKVMTGETY